MSIDSAGSTTAEHAVSVDSVPASASSSLPSSTPLTTEGGSTAATPLAAVSSTVVSAIVDSVKALISSSTTTTTTTTTTSSPTTTPFASTFSTKSSSSSSSSSSTSPLHEKIDVADLSSSLQHFGIVDYCVFILMLVVCAVIGFYFGFIEKKKKSAKKDATIDNAERRGSEALDYLVGGRKMKVFPVSLSLVASFVSGVSLLGTSTEIYVYGTQYAFILITLALSGLISWYIFLPVFCNLQLTSTYEYFELRFDKSIRLLGSILFSISAIIWLPIVIYVPALAFNQVTGVNIHIITPLVCIVCIFYTTVGGLKAVVWTDVIQTIIMVGAIILVIVKGTVDVGGLGVVWERNMKTGRIELPAWTLDITERFSALSIIVGTLPYFGQILSGNQIIVQRYLSLPSLQHVKWALINFVIGVVALTAICMYNGLLLHATYYDCDPLTTKLAANKDQLVPLLVMELLSVFPGVPGMFIAGVFSAALSSLSTGLNSLAAVFLEDYIKPFKKVPLTERQTAIIMRLTTVLIGIFSVASVFVVEILGSHVMQLSMTASSITNGPLMGLFLMGLLIPSINAKSAWTGSIGAFLIMGCICVKGQIAISTGELKHAQKPVSTEGCTYEFDGLGVTFANSTEPILPFDRTFLQYIYHMSFAFYTTVGVLLSIFIAYLSTYIFGRNDVSKMNIELFSPCIRRWIQTDSSEYSSVQTDEQTVVLGLNTNKEEKPLPIKA